MTDLIETVARAMCVRSNGQDWEFYIDIADATLRAIEAAGYKIVPVEPTEEMLKKGVHAFQHSYSSDDPFNDWRATYSAMLAAAPKVVP